MCGRAPPRPVCTPPPSLPSSVPLPPVTPPHTLPPPRQSSASQIAADAELALRLAALDHHNLGRLGLGLGLAAPGDSGGPSGAPGGPVDSRPGTARSRPASAAAALADAVSPEMAMGVCAV
jgi:hypothetical protein